MFSKYEAMNGRRVYIRYRNRCPECPGEFANHERGTRLGSFSGLPVGNFIPNERMKYPMNDHRREAERQYPPVKPDPNNPAKTDLLPSGGWEVKIIYFIKKMS